MKKAKNPKKGLADWASELSFDQFSDLCDRDGLLTDAERERIKVLTGKLPPKGTRILLYREDVEALVEKLRAKYRPN